MKRKLNPEIESKAIMAKTTKAVATRQNTAVAEQGERNAYQAFADEVRQTGIEGDLLRFNKQGEWIAGQEEEEIPAGTELIMGLNVLKRGWIKWVDNKPADSRMGLVAEGFRPCNREDLGDLDEDNWEEDDDGNKRDPWQDTMQVLLMDPNDGRVFTYATASKSGKTALGESASAYGDRLQDGEDPSAMPIIRLASSFYKHKKYGKIMIPVFELTDQWVTPPERKAEAAPKGKTKAKAKPSSGSKNAAAPSGKGGPKALPAPRKPNAAANNGRARI